MREEAGLSQAELGTPVVTRSAVSRIEAGSSAPSLVLLTHFAKRLRVKVRDLIPPEL